MNERASVIAGPFGLLAVCCIGR